MASGVSGSSNINGQKSTSKAAGDYAAGSKITSTSMNPDHENDISSDDDFEDTEQDQDYASAMESALNADDDDNEAASNDEDEEGFIYDGVDDEDTQTFKKDADEGRQDYSQRLRGILDDDELTSEQDRRTPTGSQGKPEATTSRTSSQDGRKSVDKPAPSSPSLSSSSAAFAHPPRLPSSSSTGSFYHGLPSHPRRPPMNPLVSRLRSTSGAPSLSHSSSFRSLSQSSTLPDVNGFANGSPNASFIGELPIDMQRAQYASRHSSMSNISEFLSPGSHRMGSFIGQQGIRHVSPSPSELFAETPQSTNSPARSLRYAQNTAYVSPFRWSTLRKITYRIMPPSGVNGAPNKTSTASLGEPTAMAASGIICIGTTKGWTMVFDFTQTLRCVCGNDTIIKSCGRVTALAISSDQTFIAVGHQSGHIHLYALDKPSVLARSVQPTSIEQVYNGRAEGHLSQKSIIQHIGFIGERHTAIVSGDNLGLAFYHSLGKVFGLANTDVLRILGKYPQGETNGSAASTQSANTLLAMQPLPLGTSKHFSEDYSLVALLTPVKLVVAGLKPSARTWWRCMNRGGVAKKDDEGGGSTQGCVAWLPAIDGKEPMLAFTWDKSLRLVSLRQETKIGSVNGRSKGFEAKDRTKGKEQTLKTLRFVPIQPKAASSSKPAETTDEEAQAIYQADSSILSIQWLNAQTLVILTAEHVEVFDIEHRQLIERAVLADQDIILSRRLSALQAMKTYKSKIFLFTATDVRAGILLSWADRVLQLVDAGDLVAAIELTVSYYDGTGVIVGDPHSFNSNLGLPSDPDARKAIVEPKLREILGASLDYVFSEERMRDNTHKDPSGRGVDRTRLFETLVDAAIRACLVTEDCDFLFEDMYERYAAEGIEGIFLSRLEPFVLQSLLQAIPTNISQQLLQRHEDNDELQELENLIWHLKPEYLDVNQAVRLCDKHRLYNALIYVYTQALNDFVGPLVELLGLVKRITDHRQQRPRWLDEAEDPDPDALAEDSQIESSVQDAYQIYAYLADSLVGLAHPSKEPLPSAKALSAKRSLYSFLFSRNPAVYPEGSRKQVPGSVDQLFPYLRLLLHFDSEAMLDCLDIALEDSYLDEDASGTTLDRQGIIDCLLSLSDSADIPSTDRTFINIFAARNLPKYIQFVHLDDKAAHRLFLNLAEDQDMSTREDRQLALEFLLSAYTPEYTDELLSLLEAASFYRVLASIYRSRRRYKKLVSVYVRDPDQGSHVFQNLVEVLALSEKAGQRTEVEDEIVQAIPQLVDSGVGEVANLVEKTMPSRHSDALATLNTLPLRQMAYLRSLLDPESDSLEETHTGAKTSPTEEHRLQYIGLVCDHDPEGVVAYLQRDKDLNYSKAAAVCLSKQSFDAVIWLESRRGDVTASLRTADRIIQPDTDLLIASMFRQDPDVSGSISRVVRAMRMAITLCASQTSLSSPHEAEEAWYLLVYSLVKLTRNLSSTEAAVEHDVSGITGPLRGLLSEALSALASGSSNNTTSFPRLVNRLMEETPAAQYAEYREIVNTMLQTYEFESDLLQTSNKLTQTDLFQHVAELSKEKATGWRPNISGNCEACGRSIWMTHPDQERMFDPELVPKSSSGLEVTAKLQGRPSVRRRPSLKGKETDWYEEPPAQPAKATGQSIVVFRGGAACHAACLGQGAMP